jgi:hypothetical protein
VRILWPTTQRSRQLRSQTKNAIEPDCGSSGHRGVEVEAVIHATRRRHVPSRSENARALRSKSMKPKRPNQSVELTATRYAFTFFMTRSFSLQAPLALGGGPGMEG